jgi:hypothetical protein
MKAPELQISGEHSTAVVFAGAEVLLENSNSPPKYDPKVAQKSANTCVIQSLSALQFRANSSVTPLVLPDWPLADAGTR